MTTPAPLVNTPYVERWGHPRSAVILGAGQGAPAAGTVQRWPVTVTPPTWPAVSPGVRQPEILRVRDLDDQREIIRVLHTSPAAGQWDVMRGDQGTAPVAHANGAELVAAISAEGLTARAQGVPSGHGLVIPTGASPIQSWTDTAQHRLTQITVPANEAADGGALYQATAFGYVTIPANQSKAVTFSAYWGPGQQIGTNAWTIARSNDTNLNDACRFRLDCWAAIHFNIAGQGFVTSSIRLTVQHSNTPNLQSEHYIAGPGTQTTSVATNVATDYYLTGQFTAAAPASTLVLLGGRAWRAG